MKVTKLFIFVILIVLYLQCSVSFARDNTPPTGRLSINNATILKNGTQVVGTRDVTLNIYANDSTPGVSRIALVNENNMTPIDWTSWTDSSLMATGVANTKRKSWQLSAGDGMKTVYLLVEDGDGNTTVTYNDAYRYYITYNLKGGSNGPAQGQKEVGKPYTISSTVPTKTNYDFLGWDTSSAGTKADYVGGDKYYKNADITLYAYWQPHYTIVFNGNTNTGGSTANQGMTYSVAKNLNANGFTKTGYNFNGWNTNSSGTGTNYSNQQSVNNLTSTPGGTFNLYAKWKAKELTVTLNKNGGSGGTDSVTAKYDSAMPSATMPSRTGFTFAGYYDTSATSGGTQYYTSTGGSARTWNKEQNSTLYARWNERTATLTYNANGHGTAPSSVTMRYTTATNAASAITATDYVFAGWNTKSDWSGTIYSAGSQVKAENVIPSNMTLYAMWAKARIGTTYYKTLQAAINASKSGQTVELLANTTENISISSEKNLTLNLNNHTVSATSGNVCFITGKVTINNGKFSRPITTANEVCVGVQGASASLVANNVTMERRNPLPMDISRNICNM